MKLFKINYARNQFQSKTLYKISETFLDFTKKIIFILKPYHY